MKGHTLLLLSIIAASAGCRNPFDPTADIKLIRFFANGGLFVTVEQVQAINDITNSTGVQNVRADFANYSTVPAEFTSYTVVYRQLTAQPAPVNLPAGSPIPTLGGAAGRRGYFRWNAGSLLDNTNPVGYTVTSLFPRVITAEFLSYVGGSLGTSTIGGGIDCEIIFFGTDDNGHEVKIDGTLHVDIY